MIHSQRQPQEEEKEKKKQQQQQQLDVNLLKIHRRSFVMDIGSLLLLQLHFFDHFFNSIRSFLNKVSLLIKAAEEEEKKNGKLLEFTLFFIV